MGWFDLFQHLIGDKEIQANALERVSDTVGMVAGDPASTIKNVKAIANAPFFFQEKKLFFKMKFFFEGAGFTKDEVSELRARLMAYDEDDNNVLRLIELIDKTESLKKIRYLINATRSVLTDFIDLSTFFRICHAVNSTIDEDLLYLKDNVLKQNEITYNEHVQGLLNSGLMYQKKIENEGDLYYAFTTTAALVDQFAVSFDDDTRYPNPTRPIKKVQPKTELPPFPDINIIEKEDINKMFPYQF